MTALKIKSGDTVLVISGKDKGKQGKVIRVLPAKQRLVIEGVAEVKKHAKPTPKHPHGGIVTMNAAIHVSNVLRVDADGKPTRSARTA